MSDPSSFFCELISFHLIRRFFFREWKEKYNLVDNEENDTLTYRFKNTYIFRPDLSAPGLTGDELVVIPHPSKSALNST